MNLRFVSHFCVPLFDFFSTRGLVFFVAYFAHRSTRMLLRPSVLMARFRKRLKQRKVNVHAGHNVSFRVQLHEPLLPDDPDENTEADAGVDR